LRNLKKKKQLKKNTRRRMKEKWRISACGLQDQQGGRWGKFKQDRVVA
jgi:hypothetical protein